MATGHVSTWLDGGRNPYTEPAKKEAKPMARANNAANKASSFWYAPVLVYLVVIGITLVAGDLVNSPYFADERQDFFVHNDVSSESSATSAFPI